MANILLNPNPVAGLGGVGGVWGAGQGTTTRNGASAQGGAVPPQEGVTPQRDAGALKRGRGFPCAARSPLRGTPRATLQGAPFQRVATLPCAAKTVQSTP